MWKITTLKVTCYMENGFSENEAKKEHVAWKTDSLKTKQKKIMLHGNMSSENKVKSNMLHAKHKMLHGI